METSKAAYCRYICDLNDRVGEPLRHGRLAGVRNCQIRERMSDGDR